MFGEFGQSIEVIGVGDRFVEWGEIPSDIGVRWCSHGVSLSVSDSAGVLCPMG